MVKLRVAKFEFRVAGCMHPERSWDPFTGANAVGGGFHYRLALTMQVRPLPYFLHKLSTAHNYIDVTHVLNPFPGNEDGVAPRVDNDSTLVPWTATLAFPVYFLRYSRIKI
jgi:hypothetical protein